MKNLNALLFLLGFFIISCSNSTDPDYNQYYDSLTGIAQPSSIHAHHVFPQAFAKDFMKNWGINVNDPIYGVWWEGTTHLQKAYEYNKTWESFLKSNPTFEQVMQQGREMMKENGIDVNY